MIALDPEFATLPEATLPAERRGATRDAIRMLVTYRSEARHEHHRFYELPDLLDAGDLVVVNESATLPAALRATRTNGEPLQLHIGTAIDATLWITEPRGSVAAGETLELESAGTATMIAPVDPQRPRLWYASFVLPMPMTAFLAKVGEPIRYDYVKERLPLAAYQTLFARVPGSAEMPSAGRPFTPEVVRKLRRNGIRVAGLTLHCGISSLEKPERPGPERYVVPPYTANAVNAAHHAGRRVIAIGTTVVRALESSRAGNDAIASSGWTDLIVEPSNPPQIVDGLLSGFHRPEATHIDLLRAFVSEQQLRDAYAHAASESYLCHEFGDVHLIL
jgi:S-adenosylmethionine:tRNA ribosyltransferase-isomerase